MEHLGVDLLQTRLALPAVGQSTRVRCGSRELVLERTRGGASLLVHDGSEARRYLLGIADGTLALRMQVPRHPLRVMPRQVLALAPGARLRGYLEVPLLPAVEWRGADGTARLLLDLGHGDLATEWSEEEGTTQRCGSPFLHRFVPVGDTAKAVVPVILKNASDQVACPGELPVTLTQDELRQVRGRVVAAARRIALAGDDTGETVRSWLYVARRPVGRRNFGGVVA